MKPICHLGGCQSVTRELRICALFTHSGLQLRFQAGLSVSRRNSPSSFGPTHDVSAAWDAAPETNFRVIGHPIQKSLSQAATVRFPAE